MLLITLVDVLIDSIGTCIFKLGSGESLIYIIVAKVFVDGCIDVLVERYDHWTKIYIRWGDDEITFALKL